MGRRVVFGVLMIAGALGCGLDESGLEPPDAALPDVQTKDSPTTNDVTTNDVTTSDVILDAPPDVPPPPVDAGICATDANLCQAPDVPSGWSPVAYVENPTSACPTTDWSTQDDYVTNVTMGTAACTCNCTTTADPSCTTGTISTFYSNGSGCGSTGLSLQFTNGGCVNLNGNLANYYSSTALAPSGSGSCTVASSSSGSLSTTPARLCLPTTSCQSAACGGAAPTGYAACIVADGDQACPNGSSFSVKHAVAKSASATCTSCGSSCSVTGTCTNPQVHFFSAQNCNTALVTLPSDTTCNATNHGNQNVQSANYTATGNFTCSTTATSTAQITPTTPRTVCCKP